MARVSVILPTRKRIEKLSASLDSLVKTAKNDFELLVAVDNDDLETVDFLVKQYPESIILVVKRFGYTQLHEYINRLSQMATGDWLMLWNDDSIMMTQDWDELISKQSGFKVLRPLGNQFNYLPGQMNIFPIIPKDWVRVLGYFSKSPHNDSYAQYVANEAGIHVDIPIKIEHRHYSVTGETRDEVSQEIVYESDFFERHNSSIKEDAEKIKEFINQNKNT